MTAETLVQNNLSGLAQGGQDNPNPKGQGATTHGTAEANWVMGKTGPWEVVIGLEVHAQVVSRAKLFSGASTDFGGEANDQVSFVDAAFPGMLPVINRVCVHQAIRTGMGLNGQINSFSVFDRKNYFYPDLPQGYQISQFNHPIVGKGYLDIDLEDGTSKRIGITRLHLEQDAGKSIHDQDPVRSFVDLNRSGIALMEIVSEPDMRSALEAQAYMKKLRALLRCLGTCDGNMEQGSLRADVNISLRRPGADYGTRAEIKNVNSIRFMGQAIAYEIDRQMAILESGGVVDQETRLFDAGKGVTRSMRSKEDAHDYRYFPDPDLPPLRVHADEIEAIRAALPELPDQKKGRFMTAYGLPPYDASVLTADMDVADYYEQSLSHVADAVRTNGGAKILANWMMGDVFASLSRDDLTIDQCPIGAAHLAGLITLIGDGTISGRIAKDVFIHMWDSGEAPQKIIADKGLVQVSDEGTIGVAIDQILAEHGDKVADYRSGKDKLFGFFVGQVMRAMEGKANPGLLNDLLRRRLDG